MINKKNKPIVVAVTGFVLLILGIVMACYGVPRIFDRKVKEKINLQEGSEAYDNWKVFPIPIKFKVYIFHVENPEDVQQGANPKVKERGPYIYDQYRRKEKIVVSDDNDTITYVMRKKFVFNQEDSGRYSEEDYVTVLNPALIGTALKVESIFPSALSTISDAVPYLFPGIKNVFMTVQVKDFLFNGVLLDCSSEDVEFVCSAIKGTAPETIRQHENGRDFLFSVFHHMNETDEGPYTIGRGLKSTSRAIIYEYKGEPTMGEMWYGPTCNMINGTDSTIYPSFGDEPPSRIYAFSPDLCRSVYLDFKEKGEFSGIKTYRYELTEGAFDMLEENDCFCPRAKNEHFETIIKCTPKGTMNLQPCMNAPTIFSNPHFFMGDRQLVNFVKGIKPDKKKHLMFAEIEPLTGTPVKGWKKAQMNLYLKRLEDFTILNNVSEGLMPLIWLEEGTELPEFLLSKLRVAYTAKSILDVAKWIILVPGIIVYIIGITQIFRKDNACCFRGKTRVAHFSEPAPQRHEIKPPSISNTDNQFNSTLMYPALFPQIVNRNVNTGMKKLNDDRFLM